MSRMHAAAGILLLACGICATVADSQPPTSLRGSLRSVAFAPLSAPLGKSKHAAADVRTRQFPNMQLGAGAQCVAGRARLSALSAPAGFGCLSGIRTSTLQPPRRFIALRMSGTGEDGGKKGMPPAEIKKLREKLGEQLMEAVREEDVDEVRRLVLKGEKGVVADAEWGDEFGFACIHLAAKRGNIEILKVLVQEAGADVNLRGEGALVPLHLAAQFGRQECIKFMVEDMQADPDAKSLTGDTPLRLAQSYGNKEVEEYLRPLRGTGSGQWKNEEDRQDGSWGDDEWDPSGPGASGEFEDYDFANDPEIMAMMARERIDKEELSDKEEEGEGGDAEGVLKWDDDAPDMDKLNDFFNNMDLKAPELLGPNWEAGLDQPQEEAEGAREEWEGLEEDDVWSGADMASKGAIDRAMGRIQQEMEADGVSGKFEWSDPVEMVDKIFQEESADQDGGKEPKGPKGKGASTQKIDLDKGPQGEGASAQKTDQKIDAAQAPDEVMDALGNVVEIKKEKKKKIKKEKKPK